MGLEPDIHREQEGGRGARPGQGRGCAPCGLCGVWGLPGIQGLSPGERREVQLNREVGVELQ